MAFQDDEREEDAKKIFKLKKPETGRSGTDAILSLDGDDIEFELKTVGTGSGITTVRDFGPEHIKKWKNKHWLIGIYKKNKLQYYIYATPKDMELWITEKQDYIKNDFELSKIIPKKLTSSDLFSLLGNKKKYSLDDARNLQKKQYSKEGYKEKMDLDNGYSPERMLGILKDRAEYLMKRGSTLNNPHIPESYYGDFPKITNDHAKTLRDLVKTRP